MQYLSEETQLFYIKNKQNAASKTTPCGAMSPHGATATLRNARSSAAVAG
jgi:hypothetical protein